MEKFEAGRTIQNGFKTLGTIIGASWDCGCLPNVTFIGDGPMSDVDLPALR